ncbi:NAC domain-containing protein 82 [Prosopis cineraria]|uniref:NAC domain-containing protein 82 n=1 Tax=Prosopis cineraria TaxID=364024 RepID=UPI00240EAFCD|nr:NAC domain-containing protein 82 [Prosopis cineraria]
MATRKLIPGFRFHPTDVELLRFFLKRKVMGKKIPGGVIAEVAIYKYAPWDLPDKSYLRTGDLEWFFFCPREKKYASGARMNRATEVGYWKTTGRDRPVHDRDRIVGMIKTLIFHTGRAPQGERTNWVMHEFRLQDEDLIDKGIPQDSYVLCKVFQKDGPGPRNGAQYGRPFNDEDWDDDGEIDGLGSLPLVSVHAPITISNTPGSSIATYGHPPASVCIGSSPESCLMYPSVPSDQVIPNDGPQVPADDDIVAMLDCFTENDTVAVNENNNEVHSLFAMLDCFTENDTVAVNENNNEENGNSAMDKDTEDIFEDLGDLNNTNQIYGAGSMSMVFDDFLELRDLGTNVPPD